MDTFFHSLSSPPPTNYGQKIQCRDFIINAAAADADGWLSNLVISESLKI